MSVSEYWQGVAAGFAVGTFITASWAVYELSRIRAWALREHSILAAQLRAIKLEVLNWQAYRTDAKEFTNGTRSIN